MDRDELLKILLRSKRKDIIGMILELLQLQRDDVLDEWKDMFKSSKDLHLRFYIALICILRPTFESLCFVVQAYVKVIDLRPMLQPYLFRDRQKLLLAMAHYVEETILNKEEEQGIRDLLRSFTREQYFNTLQDRDSLKIHSLYFDLPPEFRKD